METKLGCIVMQTTLHGVPQFTATIAEISLQHIHSALVSMIEQWPHKHLQVSVTDFMHDTAYLAVVPIMKGHKVCHHHYHHSDPHRTAS